MCEQKLCPCRFAIRNTVGIATLFEKTEDTAIFRWSHVKVWTKMSSRNDRLASSASTETVYGKSPQSASDRPFWLTLALPCWLLLTFFHQREFDSPTAVSRLDLIMAVCTQGRLEIDSFHRNTPDKAYFAGHYYSDKAPGAVFLSLIGSAPALLISRAVGTEERHFWLIASWAGCAVLNLVLAGGFVALVRLLMNLIFDLSQRTRSGKKDSPHCSRIFNVAFATSVFVIFGSMAWPYSTIMFSHGLSIGSIAVGLWLIYCGYPRAFSGCIPRSQPSDGEELNSMRLITFSGFAFGWALNSEFTVGLVVFGVAALSFGRQWRLWIPFLSGLAIPCLLIPTYSWLTIGVPWKLPYSYQASFPEMKQGLYAIQWPDLDVLLRLLFSPARGMIFWCPFLIVAARGYFKIFAESKRLFLITYFIPIIHVIVISGRAWDWPAGPTFSARYLAPIIPLMAIPCGFGFCALPRLGIILGIASVVVTGTATMTDATPAFDVHSNPLISLQLPLLRALDFNPNLISVTFGTSTAVGACVFICFVLLWLYLVRSHRG